MRSGTPAERPSYKSIGVKSRYHRSSCYLSLGVSIYSLALSAQHPPRSFMPVGQGFLKSTKASSNLLTRLGVNESGGEFGVYSANATVGTGLPGRLGVEYAFINEVRLRFKSPSLCDYT